MNNQIILSALQSQLSTKKVEVANYEETIYNPEISAINDQIHQWLKDNVCDIIISTESSEDNIKIKSFSNKWSKTTIYLERNWRQSESGHYMRLSAYSCDAKSGQDNDILDVVVAGKLADKFYTIENEFITVWNPLYKKASEPVNKLYSEIGELERGIRQIESDLKTQAKDKYKKIDFACELNMSKEIKHDWSADVHTLEDRDHHIKLQVGRSKYDYFWVKSFTIKAINKYKCTLEVSNNDSANKRREYTVTIKKFDDFIDQVFDWQNGGSESAIASVTDSFERRYGSYLNK